LEASGKGRHGVAFGDHQTADLQLIDVQSLDP
jgi:hypothetical protein